MKRWILLVLVLAQLLLSGCGAGAGGSSSAASSSSSASDPSASSSAAVPDAPPTLPEGTVAEGTVVPFSRTLSIPGQAAYTLRLSCRAVASGYGTWTYGVDRMELLDGTRVVQTLSILDAIRASNEAEGIPSDGEDGWTHCYEDLYLPTFEDLDFDGLPDIRLMEFLGTVNGRYLCWVWDTDAGEYRYAFTLVGYDITLDSEDKTIIADSRDGTDYYTDTYRYDAAAGTLLHLDQVRTSPDSSGEAQ